MNPLTSSFPVCEKTRKQGKQRLVSTEVRVWLDGHSIMHSPVFIENKENRENKEYVDKLCMIPPPIFRENKENWGNKDW